MNHKKVQFALGTVMVVSAVGAVPSGVSAHHAGDVDIVPVCETRKVSVYVEHIGFGGGHYMTITTQINNTTHDYTSPPLQGDGTVEVGPYSLVGYSGTITVTAQAHFPSGKNENDAVVESVDYNCPMPPTPPKKRYDTRAAIPGPCEDPFVRFVVKNKGNVADKVLMGYTGRSGVVKKIVKTIPAGMVFRTGWRYALPDTLVWVKSLSQNKVLARTSFEGGNFGRCSRVNTGFSPIR